MFVGLGEREKERETIPTSVAKHVKDITLMMHLQGFTYI